MSVPPVIDRRVSEALLGIEVPRRGVLVHGRYRDGAPTEFRAFAHANPDVVIDIVWRPADVGGGG